MTAPQQPDETPDASRGSHWVQRMANDWNGGKPCNCGDASELALAPGSAYRVHCEEPMTHLTQHSIQQVEILVRVLLEQGATKIEIQRVNE